MAGVGAGAVCGMAFLLLMFFMFVAPLEYPPFYSLTKDIQAPEDINEILLHFIFVQSFMIIGSLCSFLYMITLYNKKLHGNKSINLITKFLITWVPLTLALILISTILFHYKPVIGYSCIIGLSTTVYYLFLEYFLLGKSELAELKLFVP